MRYDRIGIGCIGSCVGNIRLSLVVSDMRRCQGRPELVKMWQLTYGRING